MGTAIEINPMLKLTNDKFDDMFCDDMSPQMKTAVAMTDALFGVVAKTRKPTDMDKLDEAILHARRVQDICGELKFTLPEAFDPTILASKDMIHAVLNNFAAIRMHYYAVANAPVEPCECGGKCDACVAARSDEYYDRSRG